MVKTALVTGADRGLGLSLVRALMERQWNVVAGHFEPDPDDLLKVRDDRNSRLLPVRMDVADLSSGQGCSFRNRTAVWYPCRAFRSAVL